MGVGSYELADVVNLTADSEYDPRARAITTQQVHHTAYPSDAGSRGLMDPGGRTVSANYLLLQNATLMEVVPLNMRAYTSASAFDHESVTIEVVNQTGGPGWAISEAQRIRLAVLARDLKALGLIRGTHRGLGGIIGHNETPGSYATACPGPDMHLDHISDLATNGLPAEQRRRKTMYLARDTNGTVWLYTDGGRVAFSSMAHVDLFNRLFYGVTPYDNFYSSELDIMHSYVLRAGDDGSSAEMAALQAAIDAIATPDPALIAQAVADAVIADINEQGVEVDTASVAAAVETQLRDEFAAIPKAVTDEIGS